MYDVIIPARNEETTIGAIVKTFLQHSQIEKVHVVVDGATEDNTFANAVEAGANTITDGSVMGKGQCIKLALHHVGTSRVILCDGDLQRLTTDHVDVLTENPSAFVIGVTDFPLEEILISPKMTWEWMPRVFESYPWISGERLVHTSVLHTLRLHGYLTEVQINGEYQRLGIQPQFRLLRGAYSPFRMTDQRREEMERDREWGIRNGVFG